MSEVLQYIVGVVAIPALVAACAALPAAVGPLRARRAIVEGGIASAVMVAFILSFTRELEWNAILRQIVAIEGDDAPFERWHRVGLTAVVLWLASWAVAIAVAWAIASTRRAVHARQASRVQAAAVSATLVLALLAAVFVRFPGTGVPWQAALGLAVCASAASFAASRRGTMLWSSWIVFGVLALLAGEGGFASLAVMCGAASMASFLVGGLWWLGGVRRTRSVRDDGDADGRLPASGAVPVVLGALVAVVALCGRACNTMEIPAAYWLLAAVLPAASVCCRLAGIRPKTPRMQSVAEVASVALAAGLLLGAFFAVRGLGSHAPASGD